VVSELHVFWIGLSLVLDSLLLALWGEAEEVFARFSAPHGYLLLEQSAARYMLFYVCFELNAEDGVS